MKIKYLKSIKQTIDEIIDSSIYYRTPIEFIELTTWEFAQFLEELGALGDIRLKELGSDTRKYKDIPIKVLR